MQHRILRAAVCLLILLAVPAALLSAAFALPAQYGETYLAALCDKWARLKETASPRIVVAGGSGVCFDLRSDLLEAELPGYRTVNFGLYAGLGTTVMLDLVLPQLHEGDILIFEPELSEQTCSTYFSAQAMWQAADGCPALLGALPASYGGAMAGAFPAFAAAKARLFFTDAAPAGEGVYARASMNAYGDMACPGRDANRMPRAYDENMPLRFDPRLPTEAFLDAVNAAAKRCEQKGVRFYFRFCPMNAAAIPAGEETRMDAFARRLEERLNCPILGSLDESVMEAGWFFDTNFHLNETGAVAATALLARDLKEALGRDGAVSILLPEMPPIAEAALSAGNNGDEACFRYEKTDNGWQITGLSEEGRDRTKLTVPTAHEGLPVLGFSAETFAGSPVLEELTLQENIRQIPDGAFSGCTALARIVLTQTAPAACSVGRGLLDGTDVRIYVPDGCLSAYATDYFWAVHARRLRTSQTAEAGLKEEAIPAPPAAPGGNEILYLANGGHLRRQEGDSVTRAMDNSHRRVNTLQGGAWFEREGYVLTGWSTAPDGSGEQIGLGSRTERRQGLRLYARWEAAAPPEAFHWEEQKGEARITAWLGGDGRCVIPEELGGLPVRRICAGAFSDCELPLLVFPQNLRCVEAGAFTDCRLDTVVISDSLREIGDDSFAACEGLQTLRVNAAVNPVYSGSYYDTFSDKYDWLLSIRDQRKIVLASGSSGRYGYDSEAIRAAFPDYEVANMGVYAWANALPQLELIRGLMKEGDVLVSAPEFDAIEAQFCVSNRLDEHFWAMLESDYDMLAALDLRDFSSVWDSFAVYQQIRSGMSGRSYTVSPANFDDDGNYYPFATYNLYGDFILPRPNGERDERQHANIADYTVDSFPAETVESLNRVYRRFLDAGIEVYFSYTPRNRSSLTEQSTSEARAALHAWLCDNLCVPVISNMEDYLLSGVYFWKIDSHTGTEGAAIRTRQLIEDLRTHGVAGD
ncbi:MAG: leucine-rich repeat protein [Oscillospiraceae bacterium]|nr:leucine-rich repeat protein [Oscillospiraceae bacterium]